MQTLIIINEPKAVFNFQRFVILIDSTDKTYLYDTQTRHWHSNVRDFANNLINENNCTTQVLFDPMNIFEEFSLAHKVTLNVIDYKLNDFFMYCLMIDQDTNFYVGIDNLKNDSINCIKLHDSFDLDAQIITVSEMIIIFDQNKTCFYNFKQLLNEINFNPDLKISQNKCIIGPKYSHSQK